MNTLTIDVDRVTVDGPQTLPEGQMLHVVVKAMRWSRVAGRAPKMWETLRHLLPRVQTVRVVTTPGTAVLMRPYLRQLTMPVQIQLV